MSGKMLGGLKPDGLRRVSRAQTPPPPEPEAVTLFLPYDGESAVTPTVSVGDNVLCGQLIGLSESAALTPVHASVSGEVLSVDGQKITVRSDKQMTLHPGCVPFEKPITQATDQELLDVIEGAGIPVSGSEQYALSDMLRQARGKVHTVVLNAVDDTACGACSAYLNSRTEALIAGVKLLARILGCRDCRIVLAADRIHDLNLMETALAGNKMLRLCRVPAKYPVSEPRILLFTLFNVEQKPGKALTDSGYAVFSPETVAAVYDAFAAGLPFISRLVSVRIGERGTSFSVSAPIGTLVRELLHTETGDARLSDDEMDSDDTRIFTGGLLLASNPVPPDTPIGKSTAFVYVPDKNRLNRGAYPYGTPACIGCGMCAQVCPAGLQPMKLLALGEKGKYGETLRRGALSCVGCGCCRYICPSKLELLAGMDDLREKTWQYALNQTKTVSHAEPPAQAATETDLQGAPESGSDTPTQETPPQQDSEKEGEA